VNKEIHCSNFYWSSSESPYFSIFTCISTLLLEAKTIKREILEIENIPAYFQAILKENGNKNILPYYI